MTPIALSPTLDFRSTFLGHTRIRPVAGVRPHHRSFDTSTKPSFSLKDSIRYGPEEGNRVRSSLPGFRFQPVFQNSAIRPMAFPSPDCTADTMFGTFAACAAMCAGNTSPAANSVRQAA
ncbi:Uncharacterised protein [Nocardia brasiliensis]|nr:Uncharacterised protein [Nocardia brasiliensis]